MMNSYQELLQDREYMPLYYQKKNGVKVQYCEKCNIEVDEKTEHCFDCQVCIVGMDHHCIFYSKCIGSGNMKEFWATIICLIANFVMIGIFAFNDADWDS